MNINKILTICIPTYNRPEYTTKLVRALLSQLKDEVGLCVRDKCGDFIYRGEKAIYNIMRNKTNIGGDANVDMYYLIFYLCLLAFII